jgi:hypothetical protein
VPALGVGLTYTQVSAGYYHTCGLVSDGSLQCWGDNGNGQTTVPALGVGLTYTQVSAGYSHTCGLVSDGSLQCWGDNGFDQTTVPALPQYYTTYTAEITPTAQGAVTVDLPANSAQNTDGAGNLAANQFSIVYALDHTVTFNGNGANGGSMTPQTASAPTALTLNAFTRTGYTLRVGIRR